MYNLDTLHVILEFIAIVIAMFIGVSAMTRREYTFNGKSSLRLAYWESFGFFCAAMGTLHALLSVAPISVDFRFAGPSTWFINQCGFAILLSLVWRRPYRLSKYIGFIIGAVISLSMALTIVKGRYYVDFVIGRPTELILVASIVPLLITLWKKPRYRFQGWLLAGGVTFLLQEVVISFSRTFNDTNFFLGHFMQIISMLCIYQSLKSFNPYTDDE